jgi:hypothetical protein
MAQVLGLLRSFKMDIYSLGNSHSAFNFNNIPEVKPIGIGPVTMYRVGRDKLDFKEHLVSGCMAIFCFGEIDVRMHLAKHTTNENENEVIEKLVKDYVETILLQRDNKVIPVIMGVTPACRATPLTPSVGADDQRARYCKKLTTYLRYYCLKYKIDLLDIYDYYADEDGHLIFDLSDKANHIWDNRFVKKVFYKFLKEYNERT